MKIDDLEDVGQHIADQVIAALEEFGDELGADAERIKQSAARIAHTATLVLIAKASGQDTQSAERALRSAWSSLRTRVILRVRRRIRATISESLREAISAILHLLRERDD